MRGINRVVVSGDIQHVSYHQTGNGTPTCSFKLTSFRRNGAEAISASVKVNAYGEGLVRLCRQWIEAGRYVLVEGELMNRPGTREELTEIRARDILVLSLLQEEHKLQSDAAVSE